MRLTCLKCGLVNPNATGGDDSCPKCGAIYSKARPAAAPPALDESRASRFGASTLQPGARGAAGYVQMLRTESQYPAFRAVAGTLAFIGYAVATLVLVGGLVAWWKAGSTGAGIGGLAAGCLIAVLSKASKEAALMLADLSDATLRMARRQEGQDLNESYSGGKNV